MPALFTEVDQAEGVQRIGDEAIGRGAMGEIRGEGVRTGGSGAGNRAHRGVGRLLAGMQRHVGSGPGQRHCHGGAESA